MLINTMIAMHFLRLTSCYFFVYLLIVRGIDGRPVRHTAVPEGSTIALPCGWMKGGENRST